MNDIQHLALESAKGGDWQLADAMELIARNKDNGHVRHGVLVNGRMRALAYCFSYFDDEDADETYYDDRGIERVVDLNGNPSHLHCAGQLISLAGAQHVLSVAQKELANAH